MNTETRVEGACVCGAVHFSFTEPVRFFQYCHCSRCRKRSGSAHAANLCVMKDQLAFTAGKDRVKTFALETAESWGNAFCLDCGSALPWLTRNGRAWIVPVGGLESSPQAQPTRNIHYASRASWHIDAKDLEHFDTVPPRTK